MVEIQEDGVVLRLVDVDGDDDTDDGRELNEDEDGVEEDEGPDSLASRLISPILSRYATTTLGGQTLPG